MSNDDLQRGLQQLSEAAAKLAEHLAAQQDQAVVVPSVGVDTCPRDCMDLQQCAEYFQVSKQSITNWQNRSEHPLPHGYVGDKPRFYLTEIRQWSHEEGERHKNKVVRRRKTGAKRKSDSTIRATLTAATNSKGGSGNANVQTLQGKAH